MHAPVHGGQQSGQGELLVSPPVCLTVLVTCLVFDYICSFEVHAPVQGGQQSGQGVVQLSDCILLAAVAAGLTCIVCAGA